MLTIWTILQNIVGLVVLLICKCQGATITTYKKRIWVQWKYSSGVSLGWFIFTHENANDNTKNHEWGHTIQSFILGPLYLLVIGLPSLIWAGCFRNYRIEKHISYYEFYTEKWADKLGGVNRG